MTRKLGYHTRVCPKCKQKGSQRVLTKRQYRDNEKDIGLRYEYSLVNETRYQCSQCKHIWTKRIVQDYVEIEYP
jgi:ribosomal protein L37AE/L43A